MKRSRFFKGHSSRIVRVHFLLCLVLSGQGFGIPRLLPQHSNQAPLSTAEISQLKAKANDGDAAAQMALGAAYQTGNGVSKNATLALQWYRKAADQGSGDAEVALGTMYRLGEGIGQDKEEAARWYAKAAKQGNARAMYNLGTCYYNGDGVVVDDVSSYAWFLLAKQAGDPAAAEAVHRAESEISSPSQRNMALVKIAQMYEKGDELPKDLAEALKWYRASAESGNLEASVRVAALLLTAGKSPTPEEYKEARRRCEDAAPRYSPGAYCMALIYKDGLGVTKDLEESARWLSRATELGNAKAALQLGEAYWKGDGVKPDLVTAYMWIWLATNSKVEGADADEQGLLKEMSAKQVEQAKRKAQDWGKQHHLLGLRQPQAASAPASQ
jgi:uncharacterized protein